MSDEATAAEEQVQEAVEDNTEEQAPEVETEVVEEAAEETEADVVAKVNEAFEQPTEIDSLKQQIAKLQEIADRHTLKNAKLQVIAESFGIEDVDAELRKVGGIDEKVRVEDGKIVGELFYLRDNGSTVISSLGAKVEDNPQSAPAQSEPTQDIFKPDKPKQRWRIE